MTCQASSIIDFELRVDFLSIISDLSLHPNHGFQINMSAMREADEYLNGSLEAECSPLSTVVHLGEKAAVYSSTT